jgi:hypothetical protein
MAVTIPVIDRNSLILCRIIRANVHLTLTSRCTDYYLLGLFGS